MRFQSRPSNRKAYREWGRRLLWVSGAGLIGMYFALLVSPFEDWGAALEHGLSKELNRVLLLDPVWDWTILILASRFWIGLMLVAAAGLILWEGRRLLRWDYGRVFAYALAACFLALAATEISDDISDAIRRPTPLYSVSGLKNLDARYKTDLRMPDDTGLPDEYMAGLACLALLLWIRLPRTSLALLSANLLHGLGQISIGQRWPMDILAGFMLGGAFGGMALWFFAGFLVWLEDRSEALFLSDFWLLLPAFVSRKLAPPSLRRYGMNPKSERRKLRRRGWNDRLWERIVKTQALPVLNVAPGDCELLAHPPVHGTGPLRASRYIRYLRLNNGETWTIRLAWQIGGFGYRARSLSRYSLQARSHLSLQRLGVPVPRLIWTREDVTHWGLLRYTMLIEEYRRGRLLDPTSRDEACEAVRLLAELHGHTRSHWGPLTQVERRMHIPYVWQALRPRVVNALQQISARGDRQLPMEAHAEIWGMFESAAGDLLVRRPPHFRLTHGALAFRHFVKAANNGIQFSEMPEPRYDLAGPEILRAFALLGRKLSDEDRRRLWIEYFEAAGEARWNEFRQQGALALALYALREAALNRLDWLRSGKSTALQSLPDWLRSLLETPKEIWGESPGLTDFDALGRSIHHPTAAAVAGRDDRTAEIEAVEPTAGMATKRLEPAAIDAEGAPAPDGPLHICHVASHEGIYRGGAVQLLRMALAQQARGHRVEVIAYDRVVGGHKWMDHETWAPLVQAGIPVEYLNYLDAPGIMKLRHRLQLGGLDVIHAHRDQALVAAWFSLRGISQPALVAQRGTVSSPPDLAARAFRSRRVRRIAAVAGAVRDALAESAYVRPDKIEVVYGSVDVEKFAPRAPLNALREQLGIPADAPVIGSLSAWRKEKGLILLLESLVEVFRRRPDAYAVFLGRKTREKLEKPAREMGIARHCRFVDHQPHVHDWLSIMTLTAVAATGREGLSGVLRESLAMEIPVISTRHAGNDEIVRDGETGLLVPPGDVRALSDAIVRALDDPEAMRAMARRGRQWVEENCAPAVQAARLEGLYRRAMADAAARTER